MTVSGRFPGHLTRVVASNSYLGRIRRVEVYVPPWGLKVGWLIIIFALCAYAVYLGVISSQWILLMVTIPALVILGAWLYRFYYTWFAICDGGIVICGPHVMLRTRVIGYDSIVIPTIVGIKNFTGLWRLSGNGLLSEGSLPLAPWGVVFSTLHPQKGRKRQRPPLGATPEQSEAFVARLPFDRQRLLTYGFGLKEDPTSLIWDICRAMAEAGRPEARQAPALSRPVIEVRAESGIPPQVDGVWPS